MTLTTRVKKAIIKLDKYSPYPRFYPFVMTEKEKAAFDQAVEKSSHYLEFGLGGSTLRALQKSKAAIYSVESSLDWTNHMREYFALRLSENRRLQIFHVDIGPTRKWGYPQSRTNANLFEDYSSSVYDSIDKTRIDLALIDGRFRVACALKMVLSCHENSTLKILIHDFWTRKHYHILLKHLNVIKRVDSLGVFSIKNRVDLRAAKEDYEAYKHNPR